MNEMYAIILGFSMGILYWCLTDGVSFALWFNRLRWYLEDFFSKKE